MVLPSLSIYIKILPGVLWRLFTKNIDVIFAAALIFSIISFNTRFQTYAYGDNSWFINPNHIDRSSVWRDLNKGQMYYNWDIIPVGVYYSSLGAIGVPINFIQTSYYFLFYFLSFLSIRYFISHIFPTKIKFLINISSYLYIFNEHNLMLPFQDRLFPVFIALPIITLWYIKLNESGNLKYAAFIAITSVFYSGSNINIATSSIIYLTMFSYFVYSLFLSSNTHRKRKTILINNLLLVILLFGVNFWWLVNFYSSLKGFLINKSVLSFSAINTGNFFDYFRLLGKWEWGSGHYLYDYFPYRNAYYSPILLLTTYLIPIISFFSIFALTKKGEFKDRVLLFFLSLLTIGLFLSKGAMDPFGKVYESIYNFFPFLKIYREPWSKFMPIVVFSYPILVYGTLSWLFNKGMKPILCLFTILILIINSFPFISGDLLWDEWNGSIRTSRVSVPSYWTEAANFLNSEKQKENEILVSPLTYTYMAFNWEHGLFTSDNPATYLLRNSISRSTDMPISNSDILINSIVRCLGTCNDIKINKIMGMMGIKYLLHENDADWRYFNEGDYRPSVMESYYNNQNLKIISSFGLFDNEVLNKIPNDEPNPSRSAVLYQELIGRKPLVLYGTDENILNRKIYIPSQIVISDKTLPHIPDIVSSDNVQSNNSLILLSNQVDKKIASEISKIHTSTMSSSILFKKDNSNHYTLQVVTFEKKLPVIFTDSFHTDWIIRGSDSSILTDTFSGDKGYQSHFIANGYANGWIIDTEKFCEIEKNSCIKENDGSVSLKISIIFKPQIMFIIGSAISVLTLFVCIFLFIRNKNT